MLDPLALLAGTRTAARSAVEPTLTLETLLRAKQLLERAAPEPFANWMQAHGCPCEAWDLVLPERFKPAEIEQLPRYVLFSPYVETPVFLRRGVF